MEYWYDTRVPPLMRRGEKHLPQSLTLERLGHCAVIVEDGTVAVEELPKKLLPENDVVIELVEVISPEVST